MNLTEPHCGTDLGLIKTKAEPQADGSYKISGTKIFISSGEHDMADNIIHLVLAKIAGAPDNVKGISLVLVPKFLVNDDGSLGERNAVRCGSIEHKMGIKASATCVMNFDGATAWQKFRFVTWPSLQTVYLTSTILSMIWTLGDFNSVYLLTGGGPADLTHVLATLGIRYLRLDQVDLSMAAIVCAMPLVLPLVYFMMKRLSK